MVSVQLQGFIEFNSENFSCCCCCLGAPHSSAEDFVLALFSRITPGRVQRLLLVDSRDSVKCLGSKLGQPCEREVNLLSVLSLSLAPLSYLTYLHLYKNRGLCCGFNYNILNFWKCILFFLSFVLFPLVQQKVLSIFYLFSEFVLEGKFIIYLTYFYFISLISATIFIVYFTNFQESLFYKI